jgi:hypothetical protein
MIAPLSKQVGIESNYIPGFASTRDAKHVAIKRIGLPDELNGWWRVGDAIEKLAPTFTRHK